MPTFKAGDLIVPKDNDQREILKMAEPDVTWPVEVLLVKRLDFETFVVYRGQKIPRDSKRFVLATHLSKSLQDYM